MIFGSSTLFVSQQSWNPCYTAQFPVSAHVRNLVHISMADFSQESRAQGGINQYSSGIMLVDRDAHCVYLIDPTTRNQAVLVGACGFADRVSNQAARISSRLTSQSSVVYTSHQHIASAYGEILVFHPFHNDAGQVCYLKCVLSTSDK